MFCLNHLVGTGKVRFVAILGFWATTTGAEAIELVHTTATLSQARSALAGTGVGDKALFAGGRSGFVNNAVVYSDIVDIYDADTDQWTDSNISEARAEMAAATAGNLVFFAGGIGSGGVSATVDIYDADTGLWETASLALARTEVAATTVGNLVFFAGGKTSSGSSGYSDLVDVYDTGTGE